MTFFVMANLAGIIQPKGLKPFRQIGFPFVVAAWGMGEAYFSSMKTCDNVVITFLCHLEFPI